MDFDLIQSHAKTYKKLVAEVQEIKNIIPFNSIKITKLLELIYIIENSLATESEKACQKKLRQQRKILSKVILSYYKIKEKSNKSNKIEIEDEINRLEIELELIKKYIYGS